MAERDKYSRSKSRKSDKRRESKHKYRPKNDCYEAKTPPLPIKITGTMQDLLEQRKNLKKELEEIHLYSNTSRNKHTKPYNNYDKNRDSSHKSKDLLRRKATETITKEISYKKRVKNDIDTKSEKEASPIYVSEDNMSWHSDEDEEKIIEQRRNKRKQLIEKLCNTKENNSDSMNPDTSTNSVASSLDNENTKSNKELTTNVSHKPGVTDMFADNDDFKISNVSSSTKSHIMNKISEASLNDNWDDTDGYYNIIVGETLNNRYTVKKILGQGVFSNVVHVQDISSKTDAAVKIVRNNDLMYKTGLKEIAILKEINDADPENKYHCIKFLSQFMHRGHLCMVLESMCVDLRTILKKYGKHHGINLKALHCYSTQLLLALKLLKKVGIIHCDIKPDNILVNEKKNILKLSDFGSATKVIDNEPVPYLVSRFYRAPEIILGLRYEYGVDMWSTACTIYELATGKIMFTGSSNNKMIKCFMDVKGKIPNKLVRKGKFKDQHFNYNYNFLLHKKDEVTGREKVVEIPNIVVTRNIYSELKHAFKDLTSQEERKLTSLKDLLDKMIMLDPNQRPSLNACLRHPFISEDNPK